MNGPIRAWHILVLALALRLGAACLTRSVPIFPAHYYADATYLDARAVKIARSWREGTQPWLELSPSQRVHARLVAPIYYVLGHRPLLAGCLHAAVGAAALLWLAVAVEAAFGAAVAAAVLALVCLWPSHIFFTSQIFKDPLALCLAYGALAAFLVALRRLPDRRAFAALAAGAASLAALGLLRSYVMVVLVAALALGAAARLYGERTRAAAAMAGAVWLSLCLGFGAYVAASRFAKTATVPPQLRSNQELRVLPSTLPYDKDRDGRDISPFTPRGIAAIRRSRQHSDRVWARSTQNERAVATQLFPDARFESWLDLARFLPKGCFYAMFMPLPGLYPLEGKPGRILASMENLALLLFAAAAALGALRVRWNAERVALAAAFALMALGSGVFEQDLGSAARHRIFYLPLLFPFAAGLLPRRRPASPGRRKVLQVLECGGPGGTGEQVAALCNHLDPAAFESVLAYSVRPGVDPKRYRSRAAGAGRAFHIPEMVRPISPFKDAAALTALIRLFGAERPDVVHAHSSKAGVLARLAAWWTGVPLVYYSPRGYSFLMDDQPRVKRLLYRYLEASVSWIGAVVAVSPSEAELARGLTWGKEVHVVADPYLSKLPESRRRPARDGRAVRVGACGRLARAKDPCAFVQLAQRVVGSRDARFHWLGDGELAPLVRDMIQDLQLEARVEVTGWLEHAEVLRRLLELDIFVHLSRWEGLPNAVLEAMAAGLPVVASAVPGNRDAVAHGETGFVAEDGAEALEYVLRLIDDEGLRERMGAAGRRRVEAEFSLPRVVSAMTELYRAPAPGGAGPPPMRRTPQEPPGPPSAQPRAARPAPRKPPERTARDAGPSATARRSKSPWSPAS